jgi:hypothetical protein
MPYLRLSYSRTSNYRRGIVITARVVTARDQIACTNLLEF